MSQTQRPVLDRPLPPEVVAGGSRWLGWRAYPVYSWPWLWRRALVFAALIGLFAAFSALGTGAALKDWGKALGGAAHLFVAFFTISQAGPLLACLARRARWPLRIERIAVVGAIVLGIGLAFLADRWASGYVEREIKPALEQRGDVQVVLRRAETPQPPKLNPGNILLLATIYALMGGALGLRPYFSEPSRLAELARQRELHELRRREREADLRLSLLQAQVEPHFLFNSLASLRALIRSDPARAERGLDALVAHLRATIPKLRQGEGEGAAQSTLGQQLDICTSYLDLMQVRMGDRLRYAVELDPALRALPFPPLLLISLVENAIKHGIEPKRGPGEVRIEAHAQDGRLRIRVLDDGAGLRAGLGAGVGLANVREQLALRYGEQARFSLGAREGLTRAEIEIPLETQA